MSSTTQIRLVIPCYDPPEGWAARLVERCQALQRALPDVELHYTLVDDGSTRRMSDADKRAVVQGLPGAAWETHPANRGKGAALRTGVAAGPEDRVLFTDVDLPYTLASMVEACRALVDGAQVVLGHRRTDYYDRVPWARRVISKTFRWVLRNVLRFPISDTQCGLKGFDAEGGRIFQSTTIDRFLFDMEFVMLVSRRKDLRVAVIDAQLDEGVRFSRMNYRILLRESLNFFKVLLR